MKQCLILISCDSHWFVSDFDIFLFSLIRPLRLNGRESPTTILTIENWKPQCICNYCRLRMYTHVNCSQSLNARDARQNNISVKYFVRLSACTAVCMSIPICILCMHKPYMYVCIRLLSIVGTREWIGALKYAL